MDHTKSKFFFLLFFIFWFEFRASHLLGRYCTAEPHSQALFGLVILEIGSRFLSGLAWISVLLLYASAIAKMTVPSHPAFYHLDGFLGTFLPRLTWNPDSQPFS
jgi:hypothetical protein